MKATTPRQVLDAMAWMLEHVGWCQEHSWLDREGMYIPFYYLSEGYPPAKMCISGAHRLVEADDNIKEIAWDAISKYTLDNFGQHPINFNDKPGRTLQDMLQLVERVKARL